MSRRGITLGRSESSDRQEILDLLADHTCRAILNAISDRALTAPEVSETVEIPLSTVYRKFDRLVDTPLVESTVRLRSNGKPPNQYECCFDRIRIRMSDREEDLLKIHIS